MNKPNFVMFLYVIKDILFCVYKWDWHAVGFAVVVVMFSYQILLESYYSCDLWYSFICNRASQMALVVKNPPANAEVRNAGSVHGSGGSPGGGFDYALQYSCLENPIDRGAWRATIHRVTQSQTQLKWQHEHFICYQKVLDTSKRHSVSWIACSVEGFCTVNC